MGKVWMCTLLVPFVLSLTASKAAQEAGERVIQPISTEAVYVGPVLDDAAFAQRVSSGGGIDVYNTWTSFRRPKEKANGDIVGHAYQICKNRNRSFFVGHVIFFRPSSGAIRVNLGFSKAAKLTATADFNITHPGFFLLWAEYRSSEIPSGYYKLLAKYSIIRGGSGSGKETAFFDMLNCN